MAYTRGRFGVEYQPRNTSETHRLRGFVAVVILFVLVAFTWYRISNRKSPPPTVPDAPESVPRLGTDSRTRTMGTAPQAAENVPRRTAPNTDAPDAGTAPRRGAPGTDPPAAGTVAPRNVPNTDTPEARIVEKWLETARTRPDRERVLLERLAEAERQKNVPVAIDTIKKLYPLPTMADLQDRLVRRLGDLNLQHLLSDVATPWTAVITAKRGDSRDRIAREHRTTPTALEKLNPRIKWERLRPGDAVRVLDFPNAVLVVYKQRGYADLSLKNGALFRRYTLAIPPATANAVYPIASESGATAHARLRALGVRVTPADRAEIEMFLASGSRIIVAE